MISSQKTPFNLRLFHYWRSSASWRVRWALAHKKLQCEFIPVSLIDGESESAEHLVRNPFGFVPVLELLPTESGLASALGSSRFLTESVAIVEWLEEVYPEPTLFPKDPWLKAKMRAFVETINAGTQPVTNLSVGLKVSEDPLEQKEWNQHWIARGLNSYEALASSFDGPFTLGTSLTFADLCLVPQCYNATRNDLSLDVFPRIKSILENCKKLPSYQESEPAKFTPKS